jgi:hypothetical protein
MPSSVRRIFAEPGRSGEGAAKRSERAIGATM